MSTCRGLKIFTGNSNLELAKKIANTLGLPLGACTVEKFSNGETNVMINENVRNYDIYIIQSISNPNLNDNLMELLIMIDAFRRSSAFRITAVIPYLGYARQDRKEMARAPITCKLVATLLQRAGIDKLIAVDLHSPSIKGFWDIPVENITIELLLLRYIKRNIFAHLDDKIYHNTINGYIDDFSFREQDDSAEKIVVSPDEGGANRAKRLADLIGLDLAVIYEKKGDDGGVALVGNVEGKVCIVIDDMADTCTKLKRAADVLHKNGAIDTFVLATHGLFSEGALDKIRDSPVREVVVTNSTAASEEVKRNPKIIRIDISQLISEAIRRQHYGEYGSISLSLELI